MQSRDTDAPAPAGRKPRTPQSERREASMTHILDRAESLFAQRGYSGVTLNEVAQEAGVATALMRYYFGDKESLFKAVFVRRGPEVNNLRLEAMARYRASAGDNPTLVGFIDAFVRPAFELMAADEGWRNYGAIVAYVNSSRGEINRLMSQTFDRVSHELIEDMRRIMPDVPDEDLYWGYHFLTGAFTFSLGQTGRIDVISGGLCKSDDFDGIADRLPVTMAGGLAALFASRSSSKT